MYVCSSVDIYISFNYRQEHIYSQQPQTHSVVLGCPIPETQTRQSRAWDMWPPTNQIPRTMFFGLSQVRMRRRHCSCCGTLELGNAKMVYLF